METNKQTRLESFTDLKVWQEGHKLVVLIYQMTKLLPQDQMFSLADQLQRASVSVTSNIAEGFSRKTTKDQLHFLYLSLGSLKEVQNQLLICRDVGYISNEKFKELANQSIITSKLLNGFIKSVKLRLS